MSYFFVTKKCKKCGAVVGVTSGVVGATFVGTLDEDVKCSNKDCDAKGYGMFETTFPEPIVEEPKPGSIQYQLNDLKKRVEALEKDNQLRGLKGMRVG
jgi:hypothetical protein